MYLLSYFVVGACSHVHALIKTRALTQSEALRCCAAVLCCVVRLDRLVDMHVLETHAQLQDDVSRNVRQFLPMPSPSPCEHTRCPKRGLRSAFGASTHSPVRSSRGSLCIGRPTTHICLRSAALPQSIQCAGMLAVGPLAAAIFRGHDDGYPVLMQRTRARRAATGQR